MSEKNPIGYLFNSIAYYSHEDVYELIDNLSYEQSIHILSKAIEIAHHSKIFTLQETELLSKSSRILTSLVLEKITNN